MPLRFPLILEIAPSRLLAGFLWTTHFLAVLGILCSGWPFYITALLCFMLLAAFLRAWRQTRFLPRKILLMADGRLSLFFSADAKNMPDIFAEVLPDALALSWVCAVSWRERRMEHVPESLEKKPLRKGVIILLPDSTDAEGMRRLALWLRWRRAASA
ncbi:MAG: hypothetical protein LBG69_03605 [Zoogloeaceae bacterium]|jgi:hypothetical protein|nr:hypothetical protein [Zoogloeaceae bacterium]